MKRQAISFRDLESGTFITRTIVYSHSISPKEIIDYFLSSISRQFPVTISSPEACVCYFSPQELTHSNQQRIDQHWIDGEIHILLNQESRQEELIVLANRLEHNRVFDYLKEQEQLIYVNTLEECWIKRKGTEYELVEHITLT